MPSDILLWRDGKVPTTKGVFLFDDKSRDIVMTDWAQRFTGVSSPDGDGPGSFDFDHDEWNEKLPGYLKKSAGSFDLGLDGKHAMCVKCRPTALAAQMIAAKEKRSTSSAFDFEPKSGRFLRLYNNALTNVPATFSQPILASATAKILLPPASEFSAVHDRNRVQVPANFDIGPVMAKDALLGILNGAQGGEAAQRIMGLLGQTQPALVDSPIAEPTSDGATLGAVPHVKYALDDSGSWDGDGARHRGRVWASSDGSGDWAKVDKKKYAQLFAYVADSGEHESDYKLPHHDVRGGHLVTVKRGVEAAGGAIQGARAPLGIPEADLPAVKHHIAAEYHLFDLKAPWEPKPAAAAQGGPVDPITAAISAQTSAQRLSMFDHMDPKHLVRMKIGHCADDMMMSAALMKHAKAAGHEEHAVKHEAHLKYMAEHMGHLTQHAVTLGMQPMHKETDGDEGGAIPAAHLSAYKQAARYGAPRHVQTLAQIQAALGITIADNSEAKIAPALLNLKETASAAITSAAQNGNAAQADATAQCQAKIAELSGKGWMAPATASQALGLNPVTGKADRMFPAWTLAQVADFETQARESRGQLSGPGVIPVPGQRQPLQQPQIDPAAGHLTPTEDEITQFVSMVGCTREEAMASLKANKAGNYGPAAQAADKPKKNAKLRALLEALDEED